MNYLASCSSSSGHSGHYGGLTQYSATAASSYYHHPYYHLPPTPETSSSSQIQSRPLLTPTSSSFTESGSKSSGSGTSSPNNPGIGGSTVFVPRGDSAYSSSESPLSNASEPLRLEEESSSTSPPSSTLQKLYPRPRHHILSNQFHYSLPPYLTSIGGPAAGAYTRIINQSSLPSNIRIV